MRDLCYPPNRNPSSGWFNAKFRSRYGKYPQLASRSLDPQPLTKPKLKSYFYPGFKMSLLIPMRERECGESRRQDVIIDCDTHFMPKDVFDYVEDPLRKLVPQLDFDESGFLSDIRFPGAPSDVPGATPLPAPGSGAHYIGNTDMESRLEEYEKMGIDAQFILPQFTGWWSYLIEPRLGNALARSWNLSMLRLMGEYSGKIYGVALVALQDVAGAIREMEW